MKTKTFTKSTQLTVLVLALALFTACVPIFVGDAFQTLKFVFKLNDAVSTGEDKIVQIIVFPENVKVKKNFVQVSGKLVPPASGSLPGEIKVEAVIEASDTGAVKQKVTLTLAIDSNGSFKGNKKIKKNLGADQMMTVTLTPSGSGIAKGTEITLCIDLVKPKSKLSQLPACVEDPVPVALTVAHADSAWDGVSVPVGQQCQSQGGVNPSTPSILVSKIPGGSDAIILEFSDRDYPPMNNGGHGKVGFMISEGTEDVVIPSIPGHSFNLPEGFFLIQAHLAPNVDTAGAYMPPCSGGTGNSYYVRVKAVKLLSADGKTFTWLGEAILELGSY